MGEPPGRRGLLASFVLSLEPSKQTLLRVSFMVLAMALALAAVSGRKQFIRSLFMDGPPDIVEGEGTSEGSPAGVTRASRVRVVLIDGLGALEATKLPVLNDFCLGGLDLEVDVGFPTVSLPVQHVLWTGLTQQQSGIWYRIAALDQPPESSLPTLSPGSMAVAESHPEIIHSFGFFSAEPEVEVFEDPDSPAAFTWRETGFEAAAGKAVESPNELVFVHILRVDEAGHAHGGESAEYDEAARGADAMLGRLWALDDRPQTRWIVLADHGHRDNGGHASAEEEIRKVRACVRGPSLALRPQLESTFSGSGSLHLVDLSRMLSESLAVGAHPRAMGRPLEAALVSELETVPKVHPVLLTLAVITVLASLGAGFLWPRKWGKLMGFAPLLALISARAILGPITLSHPVVYPPMGRDLILAMAPALVIAAAFDLYLGERPDKEGEVLHVDLRLLPLLVGPVGLALASLVACDGLLAVVGRATAPPLLPFFTATASVCLALTAACSALVAALLATRLATAWVLAPPPGPSSESPEDGPS